MVIGPVGERLQAGTENATVLERLAPLRRLHDSSAGYKYPDLLIFTYLRWLSRVCTVVQYAVLQTPEYMENGKFDPPPVITKWLKIFKRRPEYMIMSRS